ncbi:MAG: hypothetical protein EOP06_03405 [Proteobacteria bacterium]|nr:MAG: hypothetical protein EOP06_03405 [Pseudomonadota bacterium]
MHKSKVIKIILAISTVLIVLAVFLQWFIDRPREKDLFVVGRCYADGALNRTYKVQLINSKGRVRSALVSNPEPGLKEDKAWDDTWWEVRANPRRLYLLPCPADSGQ